MKKVEPTKNENQIKEFNTCDLSFADISNIEHFLSLKKETEKIYNVITKKINLSIYEIKYGKTLLEYEEDTCRDDVIYKYTISIEDNKLVLEEKRVDKETQYAYIINDNKFNITQEDIFKALQDYTVKDMLGRLYKELTKKK